ncbi:hypothetical protein J3458_008761 [Metarhizium acridum]|uniref:uncharacterized protein n=1 Tax=Metarhizium acridum TaxID=92637 RepID=UPI001C6C4DB8|nr:hypothetical protein J3458_008761 [Metarhizium acridum]
MINVNEALPGHQYPRQEEASALGSIPWSAVEGWLLLEDDAEFESSEAILDDESEAKLTARYQSEFAAQFVANRQYDDSGLGPPATQTRADPEVAILAAQNPDVSQLQNDATRFMKTHAAPIGWTENQAFPYRPGPPPPRDEPMDWQGIDLSDISDVKMEDLSERRYDNLNCPQIALAIGLTLLQSKGPNSKRSLSSVAGAMLRT